MKKNILFILIILLALFLRVYKIGDFPKTLYGDEQAFAWNAYNILKLGQDEYGNRYPLQFRSFDDYKAPIPVYLLVPFIKYLGLDNFAIRLPIVLASVATVFAVYLLSRLFFNSKISFITTLLMAISPWHVHLSRGFFEATLALLWFILGIYFFLRSKGELKQLIVSMIFFNLSIYSYFTPRILVPIFFVALSFYKSAFRKRNYLISLILLIIFSLPLVKTTIFDQGFSRFNKLTGSMDQMVTETLKKERNASNLSPSGRTLLHNKITVWIRLIKNNYLEQLSLNFWYIYGDNSLRYFLGNMGMFYLIESPFLIIGLYYLWNEQRETAVLFIGWIILAPIPASLVGRPFAVRSLALLPAPFIFAAYGLNKLTLSIKKRNSKYFFSALVSLGFVIMISGVLLRYYLEYPVYAATWWGWENKAAIDYTRERESGYNYIFISDYYTGMPLAFAVYNKIDPLVYRRAISNPIVMADGRHLIQFGKYYIGSLDIIDRKRLKEGIIPPGSLYLARPEEIDSGDNIASPDDNRVIFKIYKTK